MIRTLLVDGSVEMDWEGKISRRSWQCDFTCSAGAGLDAKLNYSLGNLAGGNLSREWSLDILWVLEDFHIDVKWVV